VLIVGLGVLGTFAHAEDEATRDEQPRRQRNKIVERVSAKYWIGVQTIPIDDALKSQLKLEDRLIVRSVMPNSPAATGGIQQHDILLKIGDRDVRNLDDLLKAVSGQKEKAVKAVVLRGGKELTLDIQPTERPAEFEANLLREKNLNLREKSLNRLADELDLAWKPLESWLGGPAGARLRMVGPGVIEELQELPGNLSITIIKHNDEPAKITVKRDDDTWEITGDEIDKLPEDLREHVRRRIHHQHGTMFPRALHLKFPGVEDGAIHVGSDALLPEAIDGVLREQWERAVQQIDQLQRRLSEDDPFKALQEEMKSLRREVEKLREREQPADPAGSDARDT
jgi:hypothetical protein